MQIYVHIYSIFKKMMAQSPSVAIALFVPVWNVLVIPAPLLNVGRAVHHGAAHHLLWMYALCVHIFQCVRVCEFVYVWLLLYVFIYLLFNWVAVSQPAAASQLSVVENCFLTILWSRLLSLHQFEQVLAIPAAFSNVARAVLHVAVTVGILCVHVNPWCLFVPWSS